MTSSRVESLALFICIGLLFGCGQGYRAVSTSNSQGSNGDKGPKQPPGGDPGGVIPSVVIPTVENWNDPIPAGMDAANCLENDEYNVCLIYKNPVFANGAPFSPALTTSNVTPADEAKIMTYGLVIPETSNLRSNHFRIVSPGALAEAEDGMWKFSYLEDPDHRLAQIQSFYWLNRQVSFFRERAGKFYWDDKRAPVIVYDSGTKDNAFFDGTGITLGYREASTGRFDVALDVTITVHEAGHGNIFEATRGAGITRNCPSRNGCMGAIHEGGGDIHAFMMFPENGVMGEYFVNNMNGLRAPDQVKPDNRTAAYFFNLRGGEIHDMGNVYASIWYEVWNQARGEKLDKEVETLFIEHLSGLNTNDTFTSALEVVESIAAQVTSNASTHTGRFRTEYQRMGVNTP